MLAVVFFLVITTVPEGLHRSALAVGRHWLHLTATVHKCRFLTLDTKQLKGRTTEILLTTHPSSIQSLIQH